MFYCRPQHIGMSVLANQQELIYIRCVRTGSRWMMRMDRESQGNPCYKCDLIMMIEFLKHAFLNYTTNGAWCLSDTK